jgi:hypothetical protein
MMTNNFFNQNIVQNHDLIMKLNNEMAEFYNFSLTLTCIMTDADVAWYEDQMKAHLCYDV